MQKSATAFGLLLSCLLLPSAESNSNLPNAINNFQLNYFKELTKKVESNVFCSGLSLSTALSMLLVGARGDTASEIRNTLGYQNDSNAEIQQYYQRLMTILTESQPGYELSVANSVWLQEGFDVLQSYKDILRQDFLAQEDNVNFASDAATNLINEWVSNQTNGKISKLYEEPLDASTSLVLVNAMYFMGNWDVPFPSTSTHKAPFRVSNEETIQVDTMDKTEHLLYKDSEVLNSQIVNVPYKGGNISMVILLPKENTGIEDLETLLTSDKLEQEISRMFPAEVVLSLPKFNVSSTIDLVEILQSLGIKKAFDNSADFTGISTGGGLSVSAAKQKAIVQVDEEGTVAAGATHIALAEMYVPPARVNVNRPFVFLIRHKPSGVNIFMGKITNPQT